MKFEERPAPIDFTEEDVNVLLQEMWGDPTRNEQIPPLAFRTQVAIAMSALQKPLFYEETMLENEQLLRIVLDLMAHKPEATRFINEMVSLLDAIN